MFLSQQAYAMDIIKRAGMQSCKPVATPVNTNPKLGAHAGEMFDNPTLYKSLAGVLQYLTFTRPDIAYAVQQICMHMHGPRSDHLDALKRVIRYIQCTNSFGLTLKKTMDLSLLAYTDADLAACLDTLRFTLGDCV